MIDIWNADVILMLEFFWFFINSARNLVRQLRSEFNEKRSMLISYWMHYEKEHGAMVSSGSLHLKRMRVSFHDAYATGKCCQWNS